MKKLVGHLVGLIILTILIWACCLAAVPAIDAELDAQSARSRVAQWN